MNLLADAPVLPIFKLQHPAADVHALRAGDASKLEFADAGAIRAAIAKAGKRGRGGPRTALVIGGNGFVGGHLTAMLAERPEFEAVYALVRSNDSLSAEARLAKMWGQYRVSVESAVMAKIHCIEASYTEPRFGLTPAEFAKLCAVVDTVFHVGGGTSYKKPYAELRHTSVLSNLPLFDFCVSGRLKQFHYMSSTLAKLYQESDDFAQADSWWYSGYSRMKWVNANLVGQALESGIPGAVYYSPYVLGDSRRGIDLGPLYSFWRLALELIRINKIWRGLFIQFLPVDVLCFCIIENALLESPVQTIVPSLPAVHGEEIGPLLNCEVLPFDRFLAEARRGFSDQGQVLLDDVRYDMLERTCLTPRFGGNVDASRFPGALETYRRGLNQKTMVQAIRRIKRSLTVEDG